MLKLVKAAASETQHRGWFQHAKGAPLTLSHKVKDLDVRENLLFWPEKRPKSGFRIRLLNAGYSVTTPDRILVSLHSPPD